jgi:Xaa-Pro dipeptidase
MAEMKPGVAWPDLHRLMWKVTLEHLAGPRLGVNEGDINEMLEAGLGAVFIPCGMGHLIGCDIHDVGGYLPGQPERIQEAGISKLRTARVLEEGMVLTVEPGLYFVDHTLDRALADTDSQGEKGGLSRFFCNSERLAQLRLMGGVRLEDVVAVTATGIENYTLAPRTPDEVESVMAGGAWPPEKDGAKWLQRKWLRPLAGKAGEQLGE